MPGFDRGIDVRPPTHEALPGLQRRDDLSRDVDVARQREAHERVAREQHQANAVALEPIQEPIDLLLREGEAARLHVLRGHAQRDVEHDRDGDTGLPDLCVAAADLRPGRRQRQQQQGERDDPQCEQPAAHLTGRRQVASAFAQHALHLSCPPAQGPEAGGQRERRRDEEDQQSRAAKVH